jgi:hypothetical protein
MTLRGPVVRLQPMCGAALLLSRQHNQQQTGPDAATVTRHRLAGRCRAGPAGAVQRPPGSRPQTNKPGGRARRRYPTETSPFRSAFSCASSFLHLLTPTFTASLKPRNTGGAAPRHADCKELPGRRSSRQRRPARPLHTLEQCQGVAALHKDASPARVRVGRRPVRERTTGEGSGLARAAEG